MKNRSYVFRFSAALLILVVLLPLAGIAQTTPTILINGQAVMASHITASPYWLSAGQTLEKGTLVKFISVLEYTIAASPGGGNVLQFEGVLSVTISQTVPANKAWKVESVGVDPTAAVFGGDNLGNHVASTHLTMGGSRINTVGNPVALADAVNSVTVQNGVLTYAADAGTANTYVVNLPIAPAAYVTGMNLNFKAANACTGAAVTLNVNSLGAKPVKKKGAASDLASGDIAAGQMVTVVYDGTNFQFVGQLGNAAGATPRGKQTFTSSGTFTVPAGVTQVWVSMAGGGGGRRAGTGGSGGGASVISTPISVTPLAAIAVTVGTGGPGGPSNNTNGQAGTTSSFGALFSCGGGSGAVQGAPGQMALYLSNGDLNKF